MHTRTLHIGSVREYCVKNRGRPQTPSIWDKVAGQITRRVESNTTIELLFGVLAACADVIYVLFSRFFFLFLFFPPPPTRSVRTFLTAARVSPRVTTFEIRIKRERCAFL